jgi:hypothetical protein
MQPELQPGWVPGQRPGFRLEEAVMVSFGSGRRWAGTGPLSTGSLGSVVTGCSAAAGVESRGRIQDSTVSAGKQRIRDKTHRAILRLQGLDALGDVAIIDVAAVNFHEVLESGGLVAGGLVGSASS